MPAGSWRHGSCKLLLRHAIMIAYFLLPCTQTRDYLGI
jgi:hypothetical protein